MIEVGRYQPLIIEEHKTGETYIQFKIPFTLFDCLFSMDWETFHSRKWTEESLIEYAMTLIRPSL